VLLASGQWQLFQILDLSKSEIETICRAILGVLASLREKKLYQVRQRLSVSHVGH
jgi:hypothetical protein